MRRAKPQDHKAVFLGGARLAEDALRLAPGDRPLVAFAGRSNVGKSSLLNALTKTKVARVSSEPGKTRELNFFEWDPWILVDLPGYGYARVSKSLREDWGREITAWLTSERSLRLVVALVDGRHGFFDIDLELMELIRRQDIPFVVAFTKMDKWKSNNQRREAEKKLREASGRLGIPEILFLSTEEKGGITPLRNVLREAALC